MNNKEKVLVSDCCKTPDLIEPDWDMAEEMGSMWRAYVCYICKKCENSCDVVEG